MHHHTMLALILVLLPVFLATRDYPAARADLSSSFVGQASLSAADYAPCDDRSRSQPGRDNPIGAE
jgi:hypothetical protein